LFTLHASVVTHVFLEVEGGALEECAEHLVRVPRERVGALDALEARGAVLRAQQQTAAPSSLKRERQQTSIGVVLTGQFTEGFRSQVQLAVGKLIESHRPGRS
jgi:hypothetical protein